MVMREDTLRPGEPDRYLRWQVEAFGAARRAVATGVWLRRAAAGLAVLAGVGYLATVVEVAAAEDTDGGEAVAVAVVAGVATVVLVGALVAALVALASIAETGGLRLQMALVDDVDDAPGDE